MTKIWIFGKVEMENGVFEDAKFNFEPAIQNNLDHKPILWIFETSPIGGENQFSSQTRERKVFKKDHFHGKLSQFFWKMLQILITI